MDKLKRYILKVFKKHFAGKLQYQRAFNFTKVLAIQGLNYGDGGSVNLSGEIPLMRRLASTYTEDRTYVVFDVGANEGGYLTALLKNMPVKNVQIWCFEPSIDTFNTLKLNHSVNSNVHFHNIGFSDKGGHLPLYTNQSGSDIASLFPLERAFGTTEKLSDFETVTIQTIDDFLIDNHIAYIDFLKLDIEGNEFNALLGAANAIKAGKIKSIQFEFGTCNIDSRTFFRDFWNLLSPQYHIYRVVKNGLSPIKSYIEYEEVFNTINYYAELK